MILRSDCVAMPFCADFGLILRSEVDEVRFRAGFGLIFRSEVTALRFGAANGVIICAEVDVFKILLLNIDVSSRNGCCIVLIRSVILSRTSEILHNFHNQPAYPGVTQHPPQSASSTQRNLKKSQEPPIPTFCL